MSNNEDELMDLAAAIRHGGPLPFGAWDSIRLDANASYAAAKRVMDAGYIKPRTITTAAEIDALPDKAILVCKYGHGYPMHPLLRGDADFAEAVLPALVVWEPKP